MANKFEIPGTFPRPGIIGRAVRLMAGLVLFYFFSAVLNSFSAFVGTEVPRNLLLWVAIVLSVYVLPEMVGTPLGRPVGRWPQVLVILLALGATAFDYTRYSSFWGPSLGRLIFLLLAYVTGISSLSFLLAGLLAVPG